MEWKYLFLYFDMYYNSKTLFQLLDFPSSGIFSHITTTGLNGSRTKSHWTKTHRTMGLLHNLGDGCRHTATAVAAWRSPRRGEIFMTAISSPRRHSSPFGDTHRHLATPIAMATPIAIWRHPSPFGDRRRQGETNRIGL